MSTTEEDQPVDRDLQPKGEKVQVADPPAQDPASTGEFSSEPGSRPKGSGVTVAPGRRWYDKDGRIALLVGTFVLGVILVWMLVAGWSTGFDPFFPDSFDYLRIAGLGPFRLFDVRPIAYPTILWMLGRNVPLAVVIQTLAYGAAFVGFGLVAVRSLSARIAALVAIGLGFLISIQPRFVIWNSQILTESLDITLSVAGIAAWWAFCSNPSLRRVAWAWLWTILWVLLRDVHIVPTLAVIVPAAVIASLLWKSAGAPVRRGLAAGALLTLLGCGAAYLGSESSNRTQAPVHNSIGLRILPDPELTSWFKAGGMPLDDALRNREGRSTWDDGEAFLRAPELEEYRRWADGEGERRLMLSMVVHFPHWSQQLINDLPGLMTYNLEAYDTHQVGKNLPRRLPWIGGPESNPGLVLWIILAAAGIGLSAAAALKKKASWAVVLFAVAGLVAVWLEIYVSYAGDSMEVNRHLVGPIARLGLMFAICVPIGIDAYRRLTLEDPHRERLGWPTSAVGRRFKMAAASLSHHRYLVLGGFLLALMTSYSLKGRWGLGLDIWEHAAVVREFATHPLNPSHPLLPLDRPHQFASPYLFALAMIVRLTGLEVTTVLNLAGLANLVLLIAGVWLFMYRLTGKRDAPFWALLFIVFLWGPQPWFFSGFLHFNVLALVLAYPATFAKAITFFALCAQLEFSRTLRLRWLVPSIAIGGVALLTHPVDAVFLAVGLIALALTAPSLKDKVKAVGASLGTIACWMLLAAAWPYYPFFELVFGASTEDYRVNNFGVDATMYQGVVNAILPALAALPLLLIRLIRRKWDPLLLMLAGTLVLYWYGYAAKEWHFGRLVASVMLVVALILADEVATAGTPSERRSRWAGGQRLITLGATLLVLLGMFYTRHGFAPTLPDAVLARVPYYWSHNFVDLTDFDDFAFLERNHEKYPVVLADSYVSLSIPTFGSKVISYARQTAFVKEAGARGADHGRFLNPATPTEERRQIASKYGAKLLVLTKGQVAAEPDTFQPMLALGEVVSENDRFLFIELAPADGG